MSRGLLLRRVTLSIELIHLEEVEVVRRDGKRDAAWLPVGEDPGVERSRNTKDAAWEDVDEASEHRLRRGV